MFIFAGYGNIAPVTAGGRGFCIFFALIGIPFTGIVLAKIGGGLSNLIKKADKFIEARIKQCLPKVSEEENTKKYVRITQLLFITFLFVIIFLIVPAASMTKTEEWPFLDAFYFCFISITTIGLGDIVPGASTQDIQLKDVGLAAIKEGTYQVTLYMIVDSGISIFVTFR